MTVEKINKRQVAEMAQLNETRGWAFDRKAFWCADDGLLNYKLQNRFFLKLGL